MSGTAGDPAGRAVVVGSGPNGLTGAVVLAHAGFGVTVFEQAAEIGGGARTVVDPEWGVAHDVCSAFHPLGYLSPAFRQLSLDRAGLRWRWPEIELAHPLDGGRAAVLRRSLTETAAGLGADGEAWTRLFGPLRDRMGNLLDDVLGPVLHVPRHPIDLARFGTVAFRSAEAVMGRFSTEEARALFAGVAAHQYAPLDGLGSAAIGCMLVAAGHVAGWPVAEGGSQSVTDALVRQLEAAGGTIETGHEVTSLTQLGEAQAVLLDTHPSAVPQILGERMLPGVRKGLEAQRPGPGAHKVDLVIEGDLPWAAPDCGRAGTVHLGGSAEEVAAALAAVDRGEMPARPFVLVGQQYLCDPGRSSGGHNPVWAYAHVPHGYDGDATDAVLAQIERFAPGAHDRIAHLSVETPAELERRNPNLVGGSIGMGATDLRGLLLRPRITRDPYGLGVPGVWLCSAATPPGPGVHGMCGLQAAQRALRDLGGIVPVGPG